MFSIFYKKNALNKGKLPDFAEKIGGVFLFSRTFKTEPRT